MALQLIQECRKRNVDCIVAPFEADAQLAYLNRKNIAQYVITEDSDLVLFGCSRVIFKLDLGGNCLLVEADKLHKAMGCKAEKYQFDKFRYMCILSGCDYLDSLPGIGLAKACKFFLMTEGKDIRKTLTKVPSYLNLKNLIVTDEYVDNFVKADATFKHMIVYDPTLRKAVRLNEIDELGTDIELCSNAGTFLDDETSFQLALGNLDPFTLRKLDDWDPDLHQTNIKQKMITKHPSIWQKKIDFRTNEDSVPTQKAFHNKIKLISPKTKTPEKASCTETMEQILGSYGANNKRPHDSAEEDSLSSSQKENEDEYNDCDITQKRQKTEEGKKHINPFAIKSPASEILSPTKITKDNSSFLKNISPVRRVGSSIFDKRSKLSKFDTSVNVDPNKKVVSRFFAHNLQAAETKVKPEKVIESPADEIADMVDITMAKYENRIKSASELYLSSPESSIKDRGEKTPVKKRSSLSSLFAFKTDKIKMNLMNEIESETNSECSAFIDECNSSEGIQPIEESSDDEVLCIESKNNVILISPEKNDSNSPKLQKSRIKPEPDVITISPEPKLKQESKPVIKPKPIRSIGLSKKGAGQSSLLMFGFQKK